MKNETAGLWGKVKAAFGGVRRAYLGEAQTVASLDKDVQGFRRLGGSKSPDDITWKHERMQVVALKLYRNNLWAKRLIEVIVDFVWGDGITVQAVHEDDDTREEIQTIIDEFWNDPVNELDREMEQTITEWLLWGEVCIPIRRNEETGAIRLGWITPTTISEVWQDTLTGKPGTVVLMEDYVDPVGQKKLDVIRYHEEDNAWKGECFFYALNTIRGSYRGVSELYSAGDWLDILVSTLRSQADRAKLDSAFVWDITVEDAGEEEIKEVEKKFGTRPKPGSARVHNQKIKVDTVSPKLGAYEFSRHIRDLKTFVLGGKGLPNHWFGSGDEANLATAAVMAEPTRKALKRKQRQVKLLVSDMVQTALVSAEAAGRIALDAEARELFEVQIPDMGGPDVAKMANAVQAFVNAVVMAVDKARITEETGTRLLAAVFGESGLEIDAEQELKNLAGGADERAAAEKKEELQREEEMRSQLQVFSTDTDTQEPAAEEA